MKIEVGNIIIIATKSTIAYKDLVQGFQGKKDNLLYIDDKDNTLELKESFDFIGDPLLSENISKEYLPLLIKTYVENLNEDSRNKIFEKFIQLENVVQDSLLLEDLPLEISPNQDIKKFLKLEELHLDSFFLSNPYGIIETVLKVHQICNLKTIPVICNVTNYLDRNQLRELNNLVKQMSQTLILIEFTDKDFKVVPEDVQFYYIDEDLIDWY